MALSVTFLHPLVPRGGGSGQAAKQGVGRGMYLGNVTDKSPIKPGPRRVARRCYKRAEVSWVWPVLAILVKVSRVRYKAIWRFGAI